MKNISVILIDDDLEDRQLFKFAIDDLEKQIDYYPLARIDEILTLPDSVLQTTDFLFIDLNMPDCNGKECIDQLKNIVSLPDIPLIAYSTSSVNSYVQESKSWGLTKYLVKPPDLQTLSNFLTAIFRKDDLPYLLM